MLPGTIEITQVPERLALLHDRLDGIKNYINAVMIEREIEVNSILLTVLSGTSCLLIGDVGAAKTQLVQITTGCLGLSLFETLINESTKPENIFGPVDVPALAQGIQRTKINGYAPTCEVLFFDEIFKASGIVLNPLLWLLNEKIYRNGDEGVIACPTLATFAASNEIPTETAMRPVYDRFLLRHQVKYIQGPANLTKLFENTMRERPVAPEGLTSSDVHFLQEMTLRVAVPAELWETMLRIREQIKRATGVEISDRRLVRTLRVVQASALLARRMKAELIDLEPLAHLFWDVPEEINRTRSLVLAHTGSMSGELFSYTETAEQVYDTAINGGNIEAGLKRLREILKVTKNFDTMNGQGVHRTITQYKVRLKNLLKQRKSFDVVKMMDAQGSTWFKLSEPTAQLWTAVQLRSAGFKLRRSLGYWWSDSDETKLVAKIRRSLKVRPNVKSLV